MVQALYQKKGTDTVVRSGTGTVSKEGTDTVFRSGTGTVSEDILQGTEQRKRYRHSYQRERYSHSNRRRGTGTVISVEYRYSNT